MAKPIKEKGTHLFAQNLDEELLEEIKTSIHKEMAVKNDLFKK
jgi:hypothetical protein